jgi:hypothetical protein
LNPAASTAGCPDVLGLTVEAVEPESASGRAGIEIGDLLVGWCRKGAGDGCVERGELQSVLGRSKPGKVFKTLRLDADLVPLSACDAGS